MDVVRVHGEPPFEVALVHGGPGGAGSMAGLAHDLSGEFGVLEPLQTESTLEGQVLELRDTLVAHASGPVALVGHSWGAWLGVILAAQFPALVQRLILVGAAPFCAEDARGIDAVRMGRLTPEERVTLSRLQPVLNDPSKAARDKAFGQLGRLFNRTDAFAPLITDFEEPTCSADIFQGVWPSAVAMRKSGRLLELVSSLSCPVVAIHGDHDPHPAQGVNGPLSERLAAFQFVCLPQCGHTPWKEKHARKAFLMHLTRIFHEKII